MWAKPFVSKTQPAMYIVCKPLRWQLDSCANYQGPVSHWILAFFCSSSFFQKLFFYFQQQLHLTLVQLLWLFKHFWLWKQWDKVWTFPIVPQWYFSFSESKGRKDWQMESLIFMTLKFQSFDLFKLWISLLFFYPWVHNPWFFKIPYVLYTTRFLVCKLEMVVRE